jgi:hypothetical protein
LRQRFTSHFEGGREWGDDQAWLGDEAPTNYYRALKEIAAWAPESDHLEGPSTMDIARAQLPNFEARATGSPPAPTARWAWGSARPSPHASCIPTPRLRTLTHFNPQHLSQQDLVVMDAQKREYRIERQPLGRLWAADRA